MIHPKRDDDLLDIGHHTLSGRNPAVALDDTVIVMGGSNSVMANGWTGWLRQEIEQQGGHRFLNMSIGAASSLIALYRLLNENVHGRNIAVIWEYAINEDVCCWQKRDRYGLGHVQNNIRRFLVECHRRGLKVLPVLLPTQKMWENDDKSFLDAIAGVFADFGVNSLRADKMYRHRQQHLRAPVFADGLHIGKGHPSRLLAQYTARMLERARLPRLPQDCAEAGFRWLVSHDFSRGRRIRFQNSLFDVPGYLPGWSGLCHPVLARCDELLGIAMIARLGSRGYDMAHDDWRISLSAAPWRSKLATQIKLFPLEAVSGHRLLMKDDQPLRFSFSRARKLLAAATFDEKPRMIFSPGSTALTGLLWQRAVDAA